MTENTQFDPRGNGKAKAEIISTLHFDIVAEIPLNIF